MIVWGKIYKSKYNHCLSYYWTKETRKNILLWCLEMLSIWNIKNEIYRMMSSNIINYLKSRLRSFWNVGNRLITQNLLQCESTHQIKLFKVIYSYLSFNLKGGKCFVFLLIKCFYFFWHFIWVPFVIDWFHPFNTACYIWKYFAESDTDILLFEMILRNMDSIYTDIKERLKSNYRKCASTRLLLFLVI